jgi:hypothetical protein
LDGKAHQIHCTPLAFALSIAHRRFRLTLPLFNLQFHEKIPEEKLFTFTLRISLSTFSWMLSVTWLTRVSQREFQARHGALPVDTPNVLILITKRTEKMGGESCCRRKAKTRRGKAASGADSLDRISHFHISPRTAALALPSASEPFASLPPSTLSPLASDKKGARRDVIDRRNLKRRKISPYHSRLLFTFSLLGAPRCARQSQREIGLKQERRAIKIISLFDCNQQECDVLRGRRSEANNTSAVCSATAADCRFFISHRASARGAEQRRGWFGGEKFPSNSFASPFHRKEALPNIVQHYTHFGDLGGVRLFTLFLIVSSANFLLGSSPRIIYTIRLMIFIDPLFWRFLLSAFLCLVYRHVV